jgi:hypothetical protein
MNADAKNGETSRLPFHALVTWRRQGVDVVVETRTDRTLDVFVWRHGLGLESG